METNDILGLIGMICGITAGVFLFTFFFAALFIGIPGLVLSIIGVSLDSVERSNLGIAGIIISAVVLGLVLIFMLFGFSGSETFGLL